MGLRETLNQNEKTVTLVTIGVIVVALLFITYRIACSSGTATGGGGETAMAYYSTDGKTWFEDDANKLYPFDKDGQRAFRANVYRCPDGTEYIGFLEGYTPEALKRLEAMRAPGASPDMGMMAYELEYTGKVVRRPEDEKFVAFGSPEGQKIVNDAPDRCEGAVMIRPGN